jgi:hypothetical protein
MAQIGSMSTSWTDTSVSPTYLIRILTFSPQHHNRSSSSDFPSQSCPSRTQFLRLSYDGLKSRSMGRCLRRSRNWFQHFFSSMLTVDLYCFHIEALHSDEEIEKLIQHIKQKGMKVGMAIKPKTPSTVLYPFIQKIDMALVMVSPPTHPPMHTSLFPRGC